MNATARAFDAHEPSRTLGRLAATAILIALAVVGAWLASRMKGPDVEDEAATAIVADRTSAPVPATRADDRIVELGRAIFFDPRLSEPAGTSCASCHDPSRGFAGNDGSSIGVARGSRPGHFARRSTPSVMYLGLVRRFHFHWEEDAPTADASAGSSGTVGSTRWPG